MDSPFPFLQGSCVPYMPVRPDTLRIARVVRDPSGERNEFRGQRQERKACDALFDSSLFQESDQVPALRAIQLRKPRRSIPSLSAGRGYAASTGLSECTCCYMRVQFFVFFTG
jgi:hypothetical protein